MSIGLKLVYRQMILNKYTKEDKNFLEALLLINIIMKQPEETAK